MRIVLVEPLGVSEEKVKSLAAGLTQAGHEFVMYDNRTEVPEQLISRAKDADAVILANLPFKEDVIGACEKLKMISVAFTGVDHVGIGLCKERGIAVSNAAGYSTPSVAELAFGMMLSLLRNSVACDAATRNSGTKNGLVGFDLCGKTLGIVGTGAIGMKVAEIGKAFGCKLLAYSRTQKEEARALGVQYVDLDTLMAQSDIVSLHTPLNESTRGLIDADKIALMKPGSYLINTARGPIVDSEALAAALNEGRIAGAGIDVFETEPPIDPAHPLLHAKNTLLAPHVAFATKEALERRADIAFDNIAAWLDGKQINTVVSSGM